MHNKKPTHEEKDSAIYEVKVAKPTTREMERERELTTGAKTPVDSRGVTDPTGSVFNAGAREKERIKKSGSYRERSEKFERKEDKERRIKEEMSGYRKEREKKYESLEMEELV